MAAAARNHWKGELNSCPGRGLIVLDLLIDSPLDSLDTLDEHTCFVFATIRGGQGG